MSLVMGLDSGGTKTIMAIADRSGQAISVRRGDGLDPSVGNGWLEKLEDLLGSQSGYMRRVDFAVLGLPYHGELKTYSSAQIAAAQRFIPDKSLVVNDVRVAFDGAFAGRPGVLVLAGTGSMAWASRNGPGDPHIRVGGWGDAFGDEGSAYWIGREALGIVSRELDGRASASGFSEALLAELGLKSDEMMGWCYGLKNRRAGIAGVGKIVSTLANDGCIESRGILQRAADHLAAHATSAWRETKAKGPLVWSHAGGVFSDLILRNRVTEVLGYAPLPPRLSPIGGAILHAAGRAGWEPDAVWIDRLAASLATLL